MDNGNNVRTNTDDHDTGTWLLALTEPGKGYLGRVILGINIDNELDEESLRYQLLRRTHLVLNPVYDYREIVKEIPLVDPKSGKMMQDPEHPGIPMVQPMRTPLVMPVGFTMEAAPVHVPGLCYGTAIRFLDEMDPRDKKTYMNFARETRGMMKAMRLQAAGLHAVTPEDIARVGGKA